VSTQAGLQRLGKLRLERACVTRGPPGRHALYLSTYTLRLMAGPQGMAAASH
jgi:hypothetical protein